MRSEGKIWQQKSPNIESYNKYFYVILIKVIIKTGEIN